MARSAAARAGPSQSQKPTQTQKTRGSRQVSEHSSSEEEELDGDEDDHPMGDGNSELSQTVNDVIRLALFTEYKRGPLRREDINKKVLGKRTRAYNSIFAIAQEKLRNSFGMELVELPSRAGIEQDVFSATQGQTQDPTLSIGIKKRATATGSKTYMLRSCLDPLLIEHAAQTHAKVLEEEGGDQALFFPSILDDDGNEEDTRNADAERPSKYYGSLISWSKGDQLGSVGILYVILALVLTNGRVMADSDLRRYLKTLRLPSTPGVKPVRFNSSSTIRSMNLDTYLSGLLKQGYLDRQQVGDTARKGKKGVGSKRLRTQAEDIEEGRAYEWRWGPRAHCEVGEENIGQFVAEFMVEREANEDRVNTQGRGAAAARKKQEEILQKMYGGIEKAAGGKLAELKL